MPGETAESLSRDVEKYVTGPRKPLSIKRLLSNKGPRQGIDLTHYRDVYPDTTEAVLEAAASLDEPIKEHIETLLLDYPVIQRTPFHIALKLTTDEWHDEFGSTPPADTLDSWDAVQEMHTFNFVTTWDMEHEDEAFDESRYAHLPDSDREHVVIINLSYAEELDALGILSLKQAQAYLLQRYGYSNKRIAELLEIESGTVSAHISRARSKLKRIHHGVGLLEELREDISPNAAALQDRCGNLYYEYGSDEYVFVDRVENWGGDDNPFYIYMVLFEDGTYTDVGVDRVPLSMQRDGDREPDFDEPYDPRRMTHDVEAVKQLGSGGSLSQ